MRVLRWLVFVLASAPALGQTAISTDEAYKRLQQRQAERAATATTQPSLADQLAAVQAENVRLRALIVDLQLKLAAINNAPPAQADSPVADATTPNTTPHPTYARLPATQRAASPTGDRPNNGETQTGTTATGIPTYTGSRGGTYHYSASGNKVYSKRK
jgi:hypothetical protein